MANAEQIVKRATNERDEAERQMNAERERADGKDNGTIQ